MGVLHSLTGTMAVSEKSVIDATMLAIDEINARGGVLGRKLQPVVTDGKSDGSAFAAEAAGLLTTGKVSVVFGCWTSASRKTVKPVFEERNRLLFYPVQYEGLEQSSNIVYTGAAPNQQIIPAVEWCFTHLQARRFFLIGSDYVFPRTAHAIIKDELARLGAQVAGEEYVLLGGTDFKTVVAKIAAAKPQVILNCINGDGNIIFMEELRAAGITPETVPVVSFSLAEDELRSMDAGKMAGHYCAWNYFQSVNRPENHAFITAFQQKYGTNRVTDDPMEAAYFGVHLWAQAVQAAGSTETAAVRKALAGRTFAAPEGPVTVDAATQHMQKTVRIGRIRPDGQFEIVWASPKPVPPVPFPESRSRAQWEKFLEDLFQGWGKRWANPGTP